MRLADVKEGDTIIADGGFTCIHPGPVAVEGDAKGLFVHCAEGKHYLAGQEGGDGDLIGLSKS